MILLGVSRIDTSAVAVNLAEKAANLTGWRATTSLEQGLAETIRWIDANRGKFQAGRYVV